MTKVLTVHSTFVMRFDGSYMIGNYSRRIGIIPGYLRISHLLMFPAIELHEFKNARWLVLGFLVTESSFCPLVEP